MSWAFSVAAQPTLDDFWNGKAHFEQVGALSWSAKAGQRNESSGWYAVRNGAWYVFNRATIDEKVDYCPRDHARIVVRESRDKGRTWSQPVTAVEPGDSPGGDDCAALDGATYFDSASGVWHILSQCLTRNMTAQWAMCHYTRKAASPLGRFSADKNNPVVKGGALWSQICAGADKACPVTTRDEGTPEILGKQDGKFVVTMHGWDPKTDRGYRGVVATRDFHNWDTSGAGLPGDAMFSARDCKSWLTGCIGSGAASTVLTAKYAYLVGEVMDKSLACQTNQIWVFELFRTPRGRWPVSGSGQWQKLPGTALLRPSSPDPGTRCQLSYARWIKDGEDLYLTYEDWSPGRTSVRRPLLQLKAGGGPRLPAADAP
jgi:hypothetical protein